MATTFPTIRANTRRDGDRFHRIRFAVASLATAAMILCLSIYGAGYYRMGLAERAESPLHPLLRPSGTIGLRMGMLGVALFVVLSIYPLRKRSKWLSSIGKTKHWLDFHVLVGIAAPVVVTFHAAFKLGGLAGIAYWIMMAVALSGFVGRFLYAQVPRSLNAVQLDMGELETQARELAAQMDHQSLIPEEVIAPLLQVPSRAEIRRMSLIALLWTMLRLDLARPLLVARLRRRVLTGSEKFTTLGGLLKSGHADLESVIDLVRKRSWLSTKMAFLDRVHQAFNLWHVVHRPFSVSFALLAVVHIGVVLMMGYF